MKKLILALALLAVSGTAGAVGYGTADEAKVLVQKAVAYIKANGAEPAFAAFDDPHGAFVDRDLYVFVYDMNGKVLAHGGNRHMIGKEMIHLTDPDGKAFVRERVERARQESAFWQDYKFVNPVTHKIEQKSSYIERYQDYIVGCGFYK